LSNDQHCLFCATGIELGRKADGDSVVKPEGIVECEECSGRFGLDSQWRLVCMYVSCPLCGEDMNSDDFEFVKDHYLRFHCEECSAKNNTCYYLVDCSWECHFLEIKCPRCEVEWATNWYLNDGHEMCPCCEYQFVIDKQGNTLGYDHVSATCQHCGSTHRYMVADINTGPVPCPDYPTVRMGEDGKPATVFHFNEFDLNGEVMCCLLSCPGSPVEYESDNGGIVVCNCCGRRISGIIDPCIPCLHGNCTGWLVREGEGDAHCALCRRRVTNAEYHSQEMLVTEYVESPDSFAPSYETKTPCLLFDDQEWEQRLKELPLWNCTLGEALPILAD
jgi:hypothetical protein